MLVLIQLQIQFQHHFSSNLLTLRGRTFSNIF